LKVHLKYVAITDSTTFSSQQLMMSQQNVSELKLTSKAYA